MNTDIEDEDERLLTRVETLLDEVRRFREAVCPVGRATLNGVLQALPLVAAAAPLASALLPDLPSVDLTA